MYNRRSVAASGAREHAVIIGAGPAGLTAALELLARSAVRPLVFEQDRIVGGLARTVEHAGNRLDLGGHRFFSKSDRVMRWWLDVLPLQALPQGERHVLGYQSQTQLLEGEGKGPDPACEDRVMLLRARRSRILHGRRLFDYPLTLAPGTIARLGVVRTARIGASYFWRSVRPRRPEVTLEDFFVNRFGDELYRTFFQSYTEKVWGRPCREISAEWGAQRVKGLSIARAIAHQTGRLLRRRGDLAQRTTETSLIERFLYPKLGPGQMWETVTEEVRARGGSVELHCRAVALETAGSRVVAATIEDTRTGARRRVRGDYFFSTMPVSELIGGLDGEVPAEVREIAAGLAYRDFLTVGVLLRRLRLPEAGPALDNWIYVQEPDVQVGRLQIFNNWSPWMVRDPATTWVGLEYFCAEGDALWRQDDGALVAFAAGELERLGLAVRADVLDGVVVRMPKAYPAYLDTYDRFATLRAWVDRFENLFLVGRNGMHRYNNQDHSMLTAMTAVDNIVAGVRDKANIWAVNTEAEYHEEKA
jgi:protoporphyrinogen oxidase